MSIVNIIDKLDKSYLYQRIKEVLNQSENNVEISKYDGKSKEIIINRIKCLMKGKEKDTKTETNTINEIYNFFEDYYNTEKINKTRKNLVDILKNLLFTKIGDNAIFRFDDTYDEKNFTINDFIYNYALVALKIDIFTKAKIKSNTINKLYEAYLYYLFKIKDPNIIIKIKIMIYNNFYDNSKKTADFIQLSSKGIFKQEINNNKTLLNLQKKYGEFSNININKVSDKVLKFFNAKSALNDNIYKFFKKENIKNNIEKIKRKKDDKKKAKDDKLNYDIIDSNKDVKIDREDIIIDDLKYNENKIFFFSVEFLIANGFKSNIEDCDFELFNKDNYSIDLFARFIKKIIPEINKSIKDKNFSNDFIKDKLIQIHKEEFIHFLSARLDYPYKQELENENIININQTDFLGINVNNKNAEDNENKNSINNKNEINISINNNDDENFKFNNDDIDDLKVSLLSSSKQSYLNHQKKVADYFEEFINNKLTSNIENKNLINLPNILFIFNLKIPEYNEETNLINFKSIHLNFFNQVTRDINENYYYGWKEIDSIFVNKSTQNIDILNSNYFKTNLTYIKKNDNNYFETENLEGKICPNSLIFCEIKKSFPNFQTGRENVDSYNVKIRNNNNKDNSTDNIKDKSYDVQLIKFIKKFRFFSKVLEDNKIENKKIDNIHFIFLYDSANIDNNSEFKDIKEMTENILRKYSKRFKSLKQNIIFQLIYFDELSYNKNKDNIIKEKDLLIKKLEEEKNHKIEEKNHEIEEKNLIIKKLKEEKRAKIEKDLVQDIFKKYNLIIEIINDSIKNKEDKKKKISELFNNKVSYEQIEFITGIKL